MIAVRLARLVVLLVIACSCAVIATERRAQTEVREREECLTAGMGFNLLGQPFEGRLRPTVAAACGQRDPTPGVRLRPFDDSEFAAPVEPEPGPRYVGAISSVSPTSVTLVERCDESGKRLERTTEFPFADDPMITIPSPDDLSGTQQATVAELASAVVAHELWELTFDGGRVSQVFPWFLDVCG